MDRMRYACWLSSTTKTSFVFGLASIALYIRAAYTGQLFSHPVLQRQTLTSTVTRSSRPSPTIRTHGAWQADTNCGSFGRPEPCGTETHRKLTLDRMDGILHNRNEFSSWRTTRVRIYYEMVWPGWFWGFITGAGCTPFDITMKGAGRNFHTEQSRPWLSIYTYRCNAES